MAYALSVFIGGALCVLQRSYGRWRWQNVYDDVFRATSRVLSLVAKDMMASTILSLGQILLLLMLLFTGVAFIACFLWKEWVQNPSQRSWVLFGGAFYLAGGLKYLWNGVLVIFSEAFVLQVSVDRRSSSTLLKRYADDLFLSG